MPNAKEILAPEVLDAFYEHLEKNEHDKRDENIPHKLKNGLSVLFNATRKCIFIPVPQNSSYICIDFQPLNTKEIRNVAYAGSALSKEQFDFLKNNQVLNSSINLNNLLDQYKDVSNIIPVEEKSMGAQVNRADLLLKKYFKELIENIRPEAPSASYYKNILRGLLDDFEGNKKIIVGILKLREKSMGATAIALDHNGVLDNTILDERGDSKQLRFRLPRGDMDSFLPLKAADMLNELKKKGVLILSHSANSPNTQKELIDTINNAYAKLNKDKHQEPLIPKLPVIFFHENDSKKISNPPLNGFKMDEDGTLIFHGPDGNGKKAIRDFYRTVFGITNMKVFDDGEPVVKASRNDGFESFLVNAYKEGHDLGGHLATVLEGIKKTETESHPSANLPLQTAAPRSSPATAVPKTLPPQLPIDKKIPSQGGKVNMNERLVEATELVRNTQEKGGGALVARVTNERTIGISPEEMAKLLKGTEEAHLNLQLMQAIVKNQAQPQSSTGQEKEPKTPAIFGNGPDSSQMKTVNPPTPPKASEGIKKTETKSYQPANLPLQTAAPITRLPQPYIDQNKDKLIRLNEDHAELLTRAKGTFVEKVLEQLDLKNEQNQNIIHKIKSVISKNKETPSFGFSISDHLFKNGSAYKNSSDPDVKALQELKSKGFCVFSLSTSELSQQQNMIDNFHKNKNANIISCDFLATSVKSPLGNVPKLSMQGDTLCWHLEDKEQLPQLLQFLGMIPGKTTLLVQENSTIAKTATALGFGVSFKTSISAAKSEIDQRTRKNESERPAISSKEEPPKNQMVVQQKISLTPQPAGSGLATTPSVQQVQPPPPTQSTSVSPSPQAVPVQPPPPTQSTFVSPPPQAVPVQPPQTQITAPPSTSYPTTFVPYSSVQSPQMQLRVPALTSSPRQQHQPKKGLFNSLFGCCFEERQR